MDIPRNIPRIPRRTFLQAAALGAVSVPRILLRAAEGAPGGAAGDRLVVLQLSGGNDGLNTLVPYESDVYQRSRPSLAIRKRSALRLAGGTNMPLGLHPDMAALRELYDEGKVAVIPGVGYPNPSRSHFRSMDIWHSARPDVEYTQDGWLGRSLESASDRLAALHLGDGRVPLAVTGKVPVPSLRNVDFLDFLSGDRGRKMRRLMKGLNARQRTGGPERVRVLAERTVADLETMVEIRAQPVPVEYPSSGIGQRLKLAGQLIAGRYPGRIFYLTQGGYDTHARQNEAHQHLLRELSEGLRAFFRHLDEVSLSKRVAVLVFSEFGRRVRENGSLGTDHGVAGPVFVLSGRARGGIHGDHPSLDDLDQGDLRHGVDFRRIYATLLEDVLGVAAEPILYGAFERLPIL